LHAEREKREDWRTAMVMCAIANVHRSKDDGALEPADIMPWLKEPEKEKRQTPAETRLFFEELTLAMGGTVHPRPGSTAWPAAEE